MATSKSRGVKVTIDVHDERTQKSYQTRAFPTGQGPGRYSAPVSFDGAGKSDIHWIFVTVADETAHVKGGNKVAARTLKLEPVHESSMRLVNGAGCVQYDVAQRFHISVNVEESH